MTKKLIILFLLAVSFSGIALGEEKVEKKRAKIKYKKVSSMTKKAEGFAVTDGYVHTWIEFPDAKGKSISGGIKSTKAIKGYVTVTFFIASWNVKSQELIGKFKRVEEKYKNLSLNFIYIFTHDTFQDAVAFSKEYEIKKALLAGHDINKAFHHSKVPSVYISDRRGWLVKRYLDVSADNMNDFDKFIKKITAI